MLKQIVHASAQLWLLSIPLLLCWSDAVHEGSNWHLLSSHLTLPCRCWPTCLEVKQPIFYLDGCMISISVPQPYFKTHKGCPGYSFRSSLATFAKTTTPSACTAGDRQGSAPLCLHLIPVPLSTGWHLR